MAELLIVRHGQASFGAANYDELSDLGRQQSRALGETLRALDWVPDRMVTGSLMRQTQTLAEMGFDGVVEEQAGWNEYDFHDLLNSRYGGTALVDVITDRKTHFRALKETLAEWQLGGIPSARETWQGFCDRIEQARLAAIRPGAERVLVVSSGGAIARLVANSLQLSNDQMIALNLQIKNSSTSRYVFSGDKFFLHEFNSVPHFHNLERAALMTYS
ncbi:histidine phosphatase family protein [Pseudophaeobacter sp.]|uniref:histidine phosphatase family protein n=1 Tax=Pseudophaeobacter sp. TaxID=1971739 RepID=UPI00329A53DB